MAELIYIFFFFAIPILLMVLIHQVFSVTYFGAKGILAEIIVAFVVGYILTQFLFQYWIVSVILFLGIGLIAKQKIASNLPIIVAVIMAIAVAIGGITLV